MVHQRDLLQVAHRKLLTLDTMEEVKAYRCKHCGKLYLRPHACQHHEKTLCLSNPTLRPLCYTCDNYKQWIDGISEETLDRITVWHDDPYDDWSEIKTFSPNRCTARPGIKLYNAIRLKEDTITALEDDKEYTAMPKPAEGCVYYKPWKNIDQ